MKTILKSIILILAVISSSAFAWNKCFSAETVNLEFGNDYLVTTEKTIKANEVSNPGILTLSPFFTIYNEKNVLLLHPLKVGKTNITFFVENTKVSYEIVIKQKNATKNADTIKKGDFEFVLLDAPPVIEGAEEDLDKYLELDPPPTNYGGK